MEDVAGTVSVLLVIAFIACTGWLLMRMAVVQRLVTQRRMTAPEDNDN